MVRKVLRMEAHERQDGDWDVKITDQSHTGDGFGNEPLTSKSDYVSCAFTGTSGYRLMSITNPENDLSGTAHPQEGKTFYCKGIWGRGEDVVRVTTKELEILEQLVKEYNEYDFIK